MLRCSRYLKSLTMPAWFAWSICLSGLWLTLPNALAAPAASENSVKAAYLYNFAKFTRWPESAFANAHSPIVLCVLGASPIIDHLQTILTDKYVDERALNVLQVTDLGAQLKSCHVIYHSPDTSISPWEILRLVQDLPVLTVGDGNEFLDTGGVLTFVQVNKRLRFDLNLPAAERANINLSARLMSVARNVRRP